MTEMERAKHLGASVRALRAYHNWTQDELAERAGLSRSQVSVVEREKAINPSVRTMRGLAKALGVSQDSLDEPWRLGEPLTEGATEE